MKKLILGLIIMAAVLSVYRITYYKQQQKKIAKSYNDTTHHNGHDDKKNHNGHKEAENDHNDKQDKDAGHNKSDNSSNHDSH